jgi:hypothetical protein
MICQNWSRFFIRRRREFTHLLISVSPLRMPIPQGMSRNLLPSSFVFGSFAATPTRKASSNMNPAARRSFNASRDALVVSVRRTLVFLKQLCIQLS